MKLIDRIKLTGSPAHILDTSRDELPQLFVDMGYKVGVEIGVYQGRYTKKFCKAGLKMYGVDPWMHYGNYRRHAHEKSQEATYEYAKSLLSPYDCTLIRKTSVDAAAGFPDRSLDFVYIDGNHAIPYVTQDIYEWYRKVRPGGVISGHDYFVCKHHPYWLRVCHVQYAVDMCVKVFGVKNYFIIGDRDKCPSWLWVKEELSD